MGTLNRTSIIGNLGGNPEASTLPSGDEGSRFSVAVNTKWTDRNGNLQEDTTWFRCYCTNFYARLANERLVKGAQVYVEGRLRSDEYGNPRIWKTDDGSPRSNFELSVTKLELLGSPAPQGGNGNGQQQQAAGYQANKEEGIPF